MPNTHLVIPDTHAKPGVSNDRFELFGRLAADLRPEVIVELGDWADMESLSSYDRGTKGFEGRRYKKDIACSRDAFERFELGLRSRGRGYHPHKVAIGGNHDWDRIMRVANAQPELDGVISPSDIGAEDFGWEPVAYRDSVELDGVTYSHFLPSGVMGRPIGGENPAAAILRQHHVSATVGHLHLYDYSERTMLNGQKIQALVAGCAFEHVERWAGKHVNNMWSRGVFIKTFNRDGTYDLQKFGFEQLRRLYGKGR